MSQQKHKRDRDRGGAQDSKREQARETQKTNRTNWPEHAHNCGVRGAHREGKRSPLPKETRHEVKTTRTATGAQSTKRIGSENQMRNTRRRSNAVDGRVAARLMLEKEVFL